MVVAVMGKPGLHRSKRSRPPSPVKSPTSAPDSPTEHAPTRILARRHPAQERPVPRPHAEPRPPTLLHRALAARQGELAPLIASAAYFFLLLFGYFLLRPVREAMGVQRSMDDLRWLFATTCAVSLLVTIAFSGLVARATRRRFIPIAHRLVEACLIAFAAMLLLAPGHLGLTTGYVFYVWLSVINLFVVSVFWAFMADVWSLDQAKRLFAAIGVGGTLGALAGSSVPWWLADHLPAPALMLLAALCFELCIRFVVHLDKRTTPLEPRAPASGLESPRANASSPPPIGGSMWEGLTAITRSPYLAAVGLYIALMATSSTLLYFAKASFVFEEHDTLSEKISAFGQLDAAAQALTLLAQLFLTTRLIRLTGVAGTLAVLPALTLVGFAALAISPTWGVLVLFQALHRATRYAVARPARETLFAVVPPAEKYKAKPVLDVFVYRAGDVAGMLLSALPVAGTLGLFTLAVTPVAAAWGALCAYLGLAQRRRADKTHPSPTPAQAPSAEGAPA